MTVIYKEYRIVMPFTVEQYNISQLYNVAQLSKQESTGDSSVEIKENIDYVHEVLGECRKTVKVININSKAPYIIRKCSPSKDALKLYETAYNAYPRCNTNYVNGYFSESTFKITVNSLHKQGVDFENNVLGLPENIWKKTEIDYIDISESAVNENFDPKKCSTTIDLKNGKGEIVMGPLTKDWIAKFKDIGIPLMTCYKHVIIEVNQFGLGWTTSEIDRQLRKLFLNAHQQMFCDIDQWINLSIDDIREIEIETKKELESLKKNQSQD